MRNLWRQTASLIDLFHLKVFLAGSTSSMLITPMSLPMQGDGGRQWRVQVVSVAPVSFLYRETFHFQKALAGVMQHAAQA